MPDFNSGQMLSSHEILRFAFDHSGMRLRHVGLYGEKVVISLRDDTAQSNLWEIVKVGQDVRLTRFPKLRPARIEGPFGNRSEGRITLDLFMRIVVGHRSDIVAMIRNVMARLVEERRGAASLEQGVIDGRLREMQGVAARLFPMEFPADLPAAHRSDQQ